MALTSLYLITDRKAAGPRGLLSTVEAAFKGGVTLVQLREKDLPAKELLSLAIELKTLAARYKARLLINDRVDIALLSGADGVHLTSTSYSPKEARGLLGENRLIGVSTHGIEEALAAEADGADFVTFGPVFHTTSKAGMGDPLGIGSLKEAAQKLSIPVFGLGGIGMSNVKEVAATGASVALISAIMTNSDPEQAATSILAVIESAKQITRSGHDTD
ncbi:MAG: thiamine-phosphate diphosphorylase [Deltaproteobacteria bacterium GWA2_54_12]|nr:MAG: thiamine-phosphate diphosphorylase [Deltaproteobacteria bacterium GWA2_54_12]